MNRQKESGFQRLLAAAEALHWLDKATSDLEESMAQLFDDIYSLMSALAVIEKEA